MKNQIALNSEILGIQDVEDNQAEKCVGGAFTVDLGDYGTSGTTAPYLVNNSNAEVYVGGFLEELTLTSVDSRNSFGIEWLDAGRNVVSSASLSSAETSAIVPNAVFARITQI